MPITQGKGSPELRSNLRLGLVLGAIAVLLYLAIGIRWLGF